MLRLRVIEPFHLNSNDVMVERGYTLTADEDARVRGNPMLEGKCVQVNISDEEASAIEAAAPPPPAMDVVETPAPAPVPATMSVAPAATLASPAP